MSDEKQQEASEGIVGQSVSTGGLERKWCFWCNNDTHNDADCWSTRPVGWKPQCYPQLTLCPTCENDFRKCAAVRSNGFVSGGRDDG